MPSVSSSQALAGFLAAAGVAHFVIPGVFDAIVPDALPGPARAYTYVSGVAEIAVAGAIAVPQSRRKGALAAAALFVAVFPANVQMALDADTTAKKVAYYGRLPLQVPLVVWAAKVSRRAPR